MLQIKPPVAPETVSETKGRKLISAEARQFGITDDRIGFIKGVLDSESMDFVKVYMKMYNVSDNLVADRKVSAILKEPNVMAYMVYSIENKRRESALDSKELVANLQSLIDMAMARAEKFDTDHKWIDCARQVIELGLRNLGLIQDNLNINSNQPIALINMNMDPKQATEIYLNELRLSMPQQGGN